MLDICKAKTLTLTITLLLYGKGEGCITYEELLSELQEIEKQINGLINTIRNS